MSIRQVLPKYHFETGEVGALAVEPAASDDDVRREARAAQAQWQPEPLAIPDRATLGGIAPPGSAVPGNAAIALKAARGERHWKTKRSTRSRSYEVVGEVSITRRATSARTWRVIFSLVPVALIVWWLWRF